MSMFFKFVRLLIQKKSFYCIVNVHFNCVIVYSIFENLFVVRRLLFADLGDGRMDSPGFLAKYCTYTFMEYHSNDILVMVFVNKRHTNSKSTNMESAGFEKALDFLIGEGLNIAEVVTNAHSVIARLMSKFDKYFVTWAVHY